jgi:hypothetical protein
MIVYGFSGREDIVDMNISTKKLLCNYKGKEDRRHRLLE